MLRWIFSPSPKDVPGDVQSMEAVMSVSALRMLSQSTGASIDTSLCRTRSLSVS